MFKKCLMLALVAGSIVGSVPAYSQSRGGTAEEQRACSRDVTRYCKTVMNADDFTVLRCLQANRPKISKACDGVLRSHGQ
jgi:hypothetical protein